MTTEDDSAHLGLDSRSERVFLPTAAEESRRRAENSVGEREGRAVTWEGGGSRARGNLEDRVPTRPAIDKRSPSQHGTGHSREDEDEDDRPRCCSLDSPRIRHLASAYRKDRIPAHSELCEAVKLGQLDRVVIMVERFRLDVNKVDGDGKTVIHIAASHRHCHDVLRYLLDAGGDVGVRDAHGMLPLHAAVSGRNAAGIPLLLRFGAAVNARDGGDATPLFSACHNKAHRIIATLLAGGANPKLTSGELERTPLHALIRASTPTSTQKRARRRSSSAPNPNAVIKLLKDTSQALVRAGALLSALDGAGETTLDVAEACDPELLRHLLLECGLEDALSLRYAVQHREVTATQKILAAGQVDPISVIDQNGKSLLHLAAARGSLELVSLLLSGEWLQCETIEPLNIDARNMQGRTALLEATFYGWVQVASFLLDFGASPTIQDNAGVGVGYTFANGVSSSQQQEVCDLLQKWGCDSIEDRERVRSTSSTKLPEQAPEGDVIYFSCVVPVVRSSKTSHLCSARDDAPPPAPRTAGESRASPHLEGKRGRTRADSPNPDTRLDGRTTPARVSSGNPIALLQNSARVVADAATPRTGSGKIDEEKGRGPDGGAEAVWRGEPSRGKMVSTLSWDNATQERNARSISAPVEDSRLSSGSSKPFELKGEEEEERKRELSAVGKNRTRERREGSYRQHPLGKGNGEVLNQNESRVHARSQSEAPDTISAEAESGSRPTHQQSHDELGNGELVSSPSPRTRQWKLRPGIAPETAAAVEGTPVQEVATDPAKVPTPAPPPIMKPSGRVGKLW